MKKQFVVALFSILLLTFASMAFCQSWGIPQELGSPGEEPIKGGRLYGAADGFHVVYTAPGGLKYKRYQNGNLSPERIVTNRFLFNPQITVTGDGRVHVVWEDWAGDGPHVGWAVSNDGGNTFQPHQLIAQTGYAKFPYISHYGASNGGEAVMAYWHAGNNNMMFRKFNGSSWDPLYNMGSVSTSEYYVLGQCRSLQDGSVYRLFGNDSHGGTGPVYRRFNGVSWDPEVSVGITGFFARASIAVNPIGQVMVMYNKDGRFHIKVNTPGVGWSSTVSLENNTAYGGITAIPGSNDFYIVYTEYAERVYGRRWSNGTLGARELVSVGLPAQFTPDANVTAGLDGSIYATWENWSTGNARFLFNVKGGTSSPMGTVSGTVTDQNGNGIVNAVVASGAYVAITGAGGAYTLNMAVGTHPVTASKDYHDSHTLNVTINQGQTTYANFQLYAIPPNPISNFYVISSDKLNRLYWTNPSSGQFRKTMIRFSTTGFPTSPTDGQLLCDRATLPGQSDSFEHTNLTNGVTYYYTAWAHNDNFVHSTSVSESATPNFITCLMAKNFADSSIVDLNNKVVTAIFPSENSISIQEQNRTSGIRLTYSVAGLSVGDVVNAKVSIRSYVQNNVIYEKYAAVEEIQKISTSPVSSLATTNRAIGGKSSPPNIIGVVERELDSNNNFIGYKESADLYNMGLLMTTTGKVTRTFNNIFYIDDGSNIQDITGRVGVMVLHNFGTSPVMVNDYVTVTGVVNASLPSGWPANRRSIKVRNINDIVIYGPVGVGHITGTVLDTNSVPISGATVQTDIGGYSATTATDGAYTIASVVPGTYSLTASKSNYTSQTLTNVVVSEMNVTNANFTLTSTVGNITGVVKDENNQGIQGATVSTSTGSYTTTTGAGGVYTLTNVSAGTYSITASKAGYNSQTKNNISVVGGQSTSVDFVITNLYGKITGFVRDGLNNGIVGAIVQTDTGGYSATTTSGGAFTISNVSPGTYSLTASKSGFSPQTVSGVNVVAGQTTNQNITLMSIYGYIAGVVLNDANMPVSGATVSTNTGEYSTTTDVNGEYILANIQPGTYSVTASRTGHISDTKTDIVVVSDEVSTADFTLVRLLGSISGNVSSALGGNIIGATITANPGGYSTTTNSSGNYTLDNIPVGNYNVTASVSDHQTNTLSGIVVNESQTTTANFILLPNMVEKNTNGNFSGGFFDFWGGRIGNTWGACWYGSFNNWATWGEHSMSGQGPCQKITFNTSNVSVGIGKPISGLIPGAPYTFSAKVYRTTNSLNTFMGVKDFYSDHILPPSGTNLNPITNQWVTRQITGTVPASGNITFYVWGLRTADVSAQLYIDDVSLLSW
ncbi:MAG: carboxypeptidase-like regulatory domain-containing protein [Armatimonadota bacterium]